jgi:hypothetical protein
MTDPAWRGEKRVQNNDVKKRSAVVSYYGAKRCGAVVCTYGAKYPGAVLRNLIAACGLPSFSSSSHPPLSLPAPLPSGAAGQIRRREGRRPYQLPPRKTTPYPFVRRRQPRPAVRCPRSVAPFPSSSCPAASLSPPRGAPPPRPSLAGGEPPTAGTVLPSVGQCENLPVQQPNASLSASKTNVMQGQLCALPQWFLCILYIK